MLDRSIPRWLPNAISVLRVLLVPLWAWCAEHANRLFEAGADGSDARRAAAAVLVAIGLSDALDGWLARRFGLQSRLGANLDAVADKLAQIVMTTYLALRIGPAFPAIPFWFLLLLIARDGLLLLGCFAIWRRRGHVDTEHGRHGKAASLCLFAVLLVCNFAASDAAVATMVGFTAVVVVVSTAIYTVDGVRQFRGGSRDAAAS
jgi:phosphatidylglycerophosphate synthase